MHLPRFPRTAPVAAAGLLLLSLAACNSKPETIVGGPEDDQKEALAHAKPVELPPAIQASKSYRCKDNSLVYIDWFAGGKMAGYKEKKDAAPTMLRAPDAGQPLVADGGYKLTGSATAASIDVTAPGKGNRTCKG